MSLFNQIFLLLYSSKVGTGWNTGGYFYFAFLTRPRSLTAIRMYLWSLCSRMETKPTGYRSHLSTEEHLTISICVVLWLYDECQFQIDNDPLYQSEQARTETLFATHPALCCPWTDNQHRYLCPEVATKGAHVHPSYRIQRSTQRRMSRFQGHALLRTHSFN